MRLAGNDFQMSDDITLDVSTGMTNTTPRDSAYLDLDGKTILICNEQSSWSINRRTYDVQRTALDNTGEVARAIADPQIQDGVNPWFEYKSFDRFRDTNTSQVNQSEHISPNPSNDGMNAKNTLLLSLGALGIVYGDIGTSPLYTIQTMFAYVPVNDDNIIGGISTLFWLLNIVVTFKYVTIVLRANNQGEGGVMALTALATKSSHNMPVTSRWKAMITMLGLLGTTLFYADSVLTPAISVLSALEGITIASPALTGHTMPIGVAILILLFLVQRFGTGLVGRIFGPMIFLWFLALSVTGVQQILLQPAILAALNPAHAIAFLSSQHAQGELLSVLGSAVLGVTGAECLYADLGHFGPLPIRLSWGLVTLPGLALNYLGQGALLMRDPSKVSNPFYGMFTDRFLLPAIALAAIATIIASQAVISGAYSMSCEAMKMGFLPRMEVCHTSKSKRGQIYVPAVNALLGVVVVVVTAAFGTSSNLAHAYGMSVTATMLVTTLLTTVVAARWCLHHGRAILLPPLLLLMSCIGALDVLLVAACSLKFLDGAWFPVVVAAVLFFFMSTWARGSTMLQAAVGAEQPPLAPFLAWLAQEPIQRTPRVAVYAVADTDVVPPALTLNLRHYKVLHEATLILKVVFADQPSVQDVERMQVTTLAPGVWRVVLRYGFKEHPDVPAAVARVCAEHGLAQPAELDTVSYFLSRPLVAARPDSRLVPSLRSGMSLGSKWAFATMHKNARGAVDFYSIPRTNTIELGAQVLI